MPSVNATTHGDNNNDEDDHRTSMWNHLEPVTLEDGNDPYYDYTTDNVGVDDDDDENHDRYVYALEIVSDIFRANPSVALATILPVLKEHETPSVNPNWMTHRATLAVWQCIMECIPMALGMDGIRYAMQVALSYLTITTTPLPPLRIQCQAWQLLRCICECSSTVSLTLSTTEHTNPIDACFSYILPALIQALASPHPPIVVIACQTITSYCRPEFITNQSSNRSSQKMLQRRVQEQRTIQPYINDLFNALFATTTTGSLTNDSHVPSTAYSSIDEEASVVVQIRKMETIAFAIVPTIQGGYTTLEPYYAHMMNTFLSYAACLFDTTSSNYTSSFIQRRAATSIEVMTMIGQTLCDNSEDDDAMNAMMKQQFTNAAQQILHWIVPVLLSKDSATTTTATMTLLHRQFVSSCIRLATIYSNDIVTIYPPYLQSMIPHLIGQITDPATDIELSVRVPDCFSLPFTRLPKIIWSSDVSPYLFFICTYDTGWRHERPCHHIYSQNTEIVRR